MAVNEDSTETNRRRRVLSVTVIATIVTACFSAFLAIIGFIGRDSFAPKIIDEIFGLSNYVLAEIQKRVDSGYSSSFILTTKNRDQNTQILFYAEEGQTVHVTWNASSLGPNPVKLKVLVDNSLWQESELPDYIVQGNVTEQLKFNIKPGANIHHLRFVPVNLDDESIVVIDSLVLVYQQ